MAFPSTPSVVKQVPELKALDEAMKKAPIGSQVGFNVAYRGIKDIEHEKWVYEKTGSSSWKVTIIKEDGTTREGGSYRGIKALQSMSDKKYNATYNGEGITKKEADILKKRKRK